LGLSGGVETKERVKDTSGGRPLGGQRSVRSKGRKTDEPRKRKEGHLGAADRASQDQASPSRKKKKKKKKRGPRKLPFTADPGRWNSIRTPPDLMRCKKKREPLKKPARATNAPTAKGRGGASNLEESPGCKRWRDLKGDAWGAEVRNGPFWKGARKKAIAKSSRAKPNKENAPNRRIVLRKGLGRYGTTRERPTGSDQCSGHLGVAPMGRSQGRKKKFPCAEVPPHRSGQGREV